MFFLVLLAWLFGLRIDYPRADRWKRPLIVPPGGGKAKAHVRVSTIKGTLNGMHAIGDWEKRNVAGGAMLRPELLGQVSAYWPPTDTTKKKLDEIVEKMLEAAGSNTGARHGDTLHTMAERVDRGEDFAPLPPFDKDIAAYQECIARHGIEIVPELIERTTVLSSLGIAGSFDRIVRKDGRLYVLDIKTGKDLEYQANGTTAVQIAFYAHGESLYRWEDDTHEPMPEVDQQIGLVLWLPVGQARAELHVVDLVAGWEAAQVALWVYEWRKRKDIARPARVVNSIEREMA